MTTPVINLGDRVRIKPAKDAPVLTVEAIYLVGKDDTPWATCRFAPKAQLIHVAVSDLERVT